MQKERKKVQINVCSGLGERGGAAPYSRGREQHLQVKKKLELFVQDFAMCNSQRLILHNLTVTHKRTGNNSKPPSPSPILNTQVLVLDTLALSSPSLVVAWNSVAPVQSLQGDDRDSSPQV